MESNNLTSRVVDDKKEFMVQTVHDTRQKVVRSSLFVNGDLLESSVMPYSDDAPDDHGQIYSPEKTVTHEKQREIEKVLL